MSQEYATGIRKHPRVEALNLVQVSRVVDDAEAGAEITAGRTLDISPGGLRLELYNPLPLRSIVGLSLALGDDVIDVKGTVTHLQVIDHERCAMGIEFQGVDDATRRTIDRYLMMVEDED